MTYRNIRISLPWRVGRCGNRKNDIRLVATLWAIACISGCTTGSAIVTGQERSPIDPLAVTLYAEPPPHYEEVGIVETASSVFFFFDEAAEERAFVELKEQAASIGANGVTQWEIGEIVEWISVYDANTGTTSPRRSKRITVTGTAIYVTVNGRNDE